MHATRGAWLPKRQTHCNKAFEPFFNFVVVFCNDLVFRKELVIFDGLTATNSIFQKLLIYYKYIVFFVFFTLQKDIISTCSQFKFSFKNRFQTCSKTPKTLYIKHISLC